MKRSLSILMIVALLCAPVQASPASRAARKIWSLSKNWTISKHIPGPAGKKLSLNIKMRFNQKLAGRVANLDVILDMAWQAKTCRLHINAAFLKGSYGSTRSAATPYVKGTIKVEKVKASCTLPSGFLSQVKRAKLAIALHLVGRRLCPTHKNAKPGDCLVPFK